MKKRAYTRTMTQTHSIDTPKMEFSFNLDARDVKKAFRQHFPLFRAVSAWLSFFAELFKSNDILNCEYMEFTNPIHHFSDKSFGTNIIRWLGRAWRKQSIRNSFYYVSSLNRPYFRNAKSEMKLTSDRSQSHTPSIAVKALTLIARNRKLHNIFFPFR